MDVENQKLENERALIRECQPILKDDLFSRNISVYIIPLDWWNRWCNYVGFFGSSSNEYPGRLNTENLSLEDSRNHAYVSKSAWKYLKSWYNGGKKLEVFIVNKSIDPAPTEITVEIDKIFKKTIKISLKLKVADIKFYMCQKFGKDPYHYKMLLKNEMGFTRKLKNSEDILSPKDIQNNEFILIKTNKLQMDIPIVTEDEIQNTNNIKHDSTGYGENFDIEMSDFNQVNIDYQLVLEIKQKVTDALASTKQKIKIRSLKTLKKVMEDIGTKIGLFNCYKLETNESK
jgi:DUSP domain